MNGTGWDVGIIARDPGRLERAADAVRAAGRKACTGAADVADAAAVEEAAARIDPRADRPYSIGRPPVTGSKAPVM
jgi:NADP-dependent 3-hydroxy acid dehydrogenase YdfG